MNGNVSARRTTNCPFFHVWEESAIGWQRFFTVLILALWLSVILPTQGECKSVLYVTPTFSVAELYEDNVFRSPKAKGDAVSRFSPGIGAAYMALPFELRGNYQFDSEIYANQSQLNRAMSRQDASLGGSYLFNRSLTFATDFYYLKSQRPEDHNATTGTFGGRASTQSLMASPSVFFRLSRRLTGDSDFSFTRSERAHGVSTDTHNAHFSLHRRMTRRDSLSISYAFRQYLSSRQNQTISNGTNNADTSSHVMTLGWTRRLTSRTSVSLEGGPRFSRGSVSPEIRATIDHLLGRRGDFSLSYGRTQHTVAGKAGPVDIEFVTLDFSYQLRRFLALDAAFAFGDNQPGSGAGTKTYNASLQLTYILNQYFALRASYKFRLQDRDILDSTQTNSGNILSDIFLVSLTFAAPTPVSLP